MNTDLNAPFPEPRRITLAGRGFLVGELTMESNAKLQAWIKANRPHPFERLRSQREAILKHLGPQDYRVMLTKAFDEGEKWPPSPLSAEGKQILFSSDESAAELLRVAVAQHGESITPEEAKAIVKGMDEAETRAFLAIIWAIHPQTAAEAEHLETAPGGGEDPKA